MKIPFLIYYINHCVFLLQSLIFCIIFHDIFVIIKLLYLDFDLYEPTLVALNNFYELVPSGGVVVFDEIGNEKFVGETLAFKEFFKNKSVELKKFEFEPWISYFIKK